jgi:hypothetical protein
MAFQTAVSQGMGYGVVGERAFDDPFRVREYILASVNAANNIFGNVGTLVAGTDNNVTMGGTGLFCGFLVDPKNHASNGTVSGGTLAPSLLLPNGEPAAFLTMGTIWVTLPAAAAIGDHVLFDNVTGALTTGTPGTTVPTGKTYAQAVVSYYTVAAAGLACITVTPLIVTP